jgi:cephalosporin-C deacetylase-like acetyl esterase
VNESRCGEILTLSFAVRMGDQTCMVTRRNFLATNMTAAAISTLGLHRPILGDAVPKGFVPESQIPRSHRDFWNDWPNYMTVKMNDARASRRALLAQIGSKAQVEARNDTVRAQLWQLLGGRPEETPLNARVTGTVERNGYRIEKLIFESLPQIYVTANLYVPTTGKPPFPAILAPIGHSPNGKAALRYQYTYQNLARKGYIVLTWDPFGQGERIQYLQPETNHTRFHAVSMEHTQGGRPMILFGHGLALYLAWDGIRGLDYLLTRPEVDPKRVGCTGQSGGGTMTMFLGALEPRIHAAVAIEGAFANLAGPYYDPPGSISDAETDLVGSLPLHIDRGDLLAAFAPKPLLVCYTKNDEGQTYGPHNSEAILEDYDELTRVYGILGARDKVDLFAGDLPHGMDFFSRRAVYGWFNRWFDKMDAGVEEAEYDAAPDNSLNVTPSGQVSTSLGGRSIVQLNTDRAKRLLPISDFTNENIDLSHTREKVRTQLTELLAFPGERTALHAQVLSSNLRKQQKIEEIQFESEPGVRIVGWFVAPQVGKSTHPCILYVSNGYSDDVVAEPSSFDEVVRQGYAVCAIAVRGTGLSTPRPPKAGPVFYQQMNLEERFAWANLVLGSCVMGQRVWDILRTLDYLVARPDVDSSQVRMIGQEEAGLAALMAAVIDNRIQSILLTRTIVSYMSVVQSTDYSLPLDWFIPGILRHFDIPDLAAAVSPRSVWMVNTVGASGVILPVREVDALYAQRIPNHSPARKNLTIVNTPHDDHATYMEWLQRE